VNTHFGSEAINPKLLTIKRENIVNSLGVPSDKADEYLTGLIDELIERCMQLCTPRAGITIYDNPFFSKENGTMIIKGTSFNLNRMVTSALSKSTYIAFFAGTCGEKTGEYSADFLKKGHGLEGLIVDLIGSEIAEGVAEYIHTRISSEMVTEGLSTTNRYSPGYCNWPVSDQHKLFMLLGGNNCGIKLTESSLMIPIKSVSGLVGLGKDVVNRGYACAWCDADHCLYRDKK